MSGEAWLPVDVLARDEVQTAVRRALADWCAQWFVRSRMIVTGFWPTAGAGGSCGGAPWTIPGEMVAVSCPARSAARLAGWALDADVDPAAHRKADRRLLDLFERTLIEDLARRVEQALGVAPETSRPALGGPPFGVLGGVVIEISDESGGEILRLAAPLQAVLPFCRAALPPAPKAGAMGKVVRALGGADLAIEARLGVADISVGDLRELAAGDILVLRHGVTDAVEVSLAGAETAFARAKLIDLDGQIAIALET